ncbi:tRNA pseudouridine(38-40) synthase TruA [Pacificimonas sp. WHA3]|uniref:tRNA pseudouridine synthase A n=1 Tax=Pacificimonas pallii TaxID=2827236 RepID=A0ABS6SD62_9SPHN|nr:tRNA pseudouridine(38-40) synthase TruA [Pacificimonas pallii]MBV7256349.1 tRNA pseudouridine(38-40) synthase TruA [Pacificimonas pallii]
MQRFRLTIEYDGQPFMGWQRQPHGPTVQAAIEDAFGAFAGEIPTLFGSGRTDTGVHALGQVAHVDIVRPFTPFRVMEALNAKLRPLPISILKCEAVDADFHARFDCRGRSYEYVIRNRRAPLTLTRGREWLVSRALDVDAMNQAAAHLVGTHDFTTFRASRCQALSPVKTLTSLDVSRSGDRIFIRAAAPSFLHHQIRSITGCLVMVGDGRWTPIDMLSALQARDRTALGHNAPPDGLYFMNATYG